ncbi:hypothetical protein MMC12_001046 [Toensbergia leucococca]|nr:hypothetical protein [Toensbergia leucococca]
MPNKRWILSVSPVQTDIAKPGRLVTNRETPQNYFDVRGDPDLKQADPRLTKTEFRDLAEFHSQFNSNKFQVNLTSFFSKHLKIGSDTIRSIEAARAERRQLVQADEWLYNICSTKAARSWLERNIISLKKKVWMITDILVLTDAKIKSVDKHTHAVGGEISAPVLSIAGVTIPTPLDPSVGARTARDSSHERAVSVPEKMVFAIQYSQVKLLKRKRSEIVKTPDYGLHSKATWTPLWEMRSAPEEHHKRRVDSDEESDDDEYDEEAEPENDDEEVLEVALAGDGDEREHDDDDDDDDDDGDNINT